MELGARRLLVLVGEVKDIAGLTSKRLTEAPRCRGGVPRNRGPLRPEASD